MSIPQVSKATVTTALLCAAFLCCSIRSTAYAEALIDPQTDLGVTKTGPDQAAANTNVTYQIIVANNGPDNADNATMTDTLPAGLTFVSLASPSGWSCTTPGVGNTGTITCINPSLVATPNELFTLVAHTDSAVVAGSFITNKAAVSTTTPDINEENNESAASVQVAGGTTTNVGVTMLSDKETAFAGDSVTYAITVVSGANASNVSLTDALPPGMTFVSISFPTGWNCAHPPPGSGGNVTCTIGTLGPTTGQAFNLTANIPIATPDGTVFTNSATVATTTPDSNSEDDSTSTATTVAASNIVSATNGSGQNAAINSPFPIALQATVTLSGVPQSGVTVMFQAPGSGPSGAFAGTNATTESIITDTNGIATASLFTSNNTAGGPYNVVASTTGSTSTGTFVLTNTKATQTISFNPPPNKTYGDDPFLISATASSGLPITFNISSGPATINANTITLTGAGTIMIRALQAGNSNYNLASLTTSIAVAKAPATATNISSSTNPSGFGQSVTFITTISPPPNTRPPTGTVQFKDGPNTLGAATGCIAGGGNCSAQLSISTLTPGTHSISANYSGDQNFAPVSATLPGGQVVTTLPALSINDFSKTEGNSEATRFDFTVSLSAASTLTVKVDYATADGTATVSNYDYQPVSGTLIFSPGDQSKTITVFVNGDLNREPDEAFFVNLTNPNNASISRTPGIGIIINDDTVDPPQLLLEESGPTTNQAAAFDSILFLRDPFSVRSPAEWLDLGPDRNTRVMLFAATLKLSNGETAAAVVVNLIGANSQSYDIPAEDVRPIPNSTFTQVVFRLPDSLVAGTALITLKAHGQFSNSAVIRIK